MEVQSKQLVDGQELTNPSVQCTLTSLPETSGSLLGERAEHCAVSLSSNSIFMPGGIIENEDKQSYSLVTDLLLMHDVL